MVKKTPNAIAPSSNRPTTIGTTINAISVGDAPVSARRAWKRLEWIPLFNFDIYNVTYTAIVIKQSRRWMERWVGDRIVKRDNNGGEESEKYRHRPNLALRRWRKGISECRVDRIEVVIKVTNHFGAIGSREPFRTVALIRHFCRATLNAHTTVLADIHAQTRIAEITVHSTFTRFASTSGKEESKGYFDRSYKNQFHSLEWSPGVHTGSSSTAHDPSNNTFINVILTVFTLESCTRAITLVLSHHIYALSMFTWLGSTLIDLGFAVLSSES